MPHSMHSDEPIPRFDPPNGRRSKSRRLSDAFQRAKVKTRDAFGIEKPEEIDKRTSIDKTIDELHDNPAYDPLRFLRKPEKDGKLKTEKVREALSSAGHAIINPMAAIKSRATKATAGKLAGPRPYMNRNVDLAFLEALDEVADTKPIECHCGEDNYDCRCKDDQAENDQKVEELDRRVDEMEQTRLNMRAAWSTNRHVQRVRTVRRERGLWPGVETFEVIDEDGNRELKLGELIGKWLLHVSHPYTAQYVDDFDVLPFNSQIFRRHLERLILVSGPIQDFLIHVQMVYRWENPYLTTTYMVLYFALLYFKQMMTFTLGYIIFVVVENYVHPTDVQKLRDSIARTLDRGTTAFRIAELMDKHGNSEWLGPFIEEIGPYIQVQVNDIANLLEVGYNFYHWRSPAKTRATLMLLFAAFLTCFCASTEFCLTIVYFLAGFWFFVCLPVSSRFPQYRLLVSPVKWVFWDIPTHAEWSFQYLQQRSVGVLKAIGDKTGKWTGTEGFGGVTVDQNGLHVDEDESLGRDSSSTSPADIMSFSCMHAHTPGELILSATGIRFRSALPHLLDPHPSTDFFITYAQIDEMRKRSPNRWGLKKAMKHMALEGLELKVWNFEDINKDVKVGDEVITSIMLQAVRGRDRMFNAIVGFSGFKWQNMATGWDD